MLSGIHRKLHQLRQPPSDFGSLRGDRKCRSHRHRQAFPPQRARKQAAQKTAKVYPMCTSYGGAVITEAGTDSAVVGLVYAAHMPDSGKKESEGGKRFPSDLAKSGAIKKLPDGFTYIDPGRFHELFAADLPVEQAAFMARSQVFNFTDNVSATITTAAWRTKPSWMLVAGADKTISPDLERWYASRAKSHTVEIAGASHVVYISRPKEVAALIQDATLHTR